MPGPDHVRWSGQQDAVLNGEIVEALTPVDGLKTAYDQLKPFERQFVDAYLASDSPIQAVKAVFPMDGVDPKKVASTLRVRAYDLIRRPLVQAAIAEKLTKHAAQWDLTTERVLAELAKVAYANIDDYLDRSTGEPIFDFTEERVSRDQMAAVGELTVETYNEKADDGEVRVVKRVKFKLHDKLGALEKAMKHLGLYAPEKVDLRGIVRTVTDATTGQSVERITVDMTDDEAGEAYARYLMGER